MKGAEIRQLIERDPFVLFHFDGVFARDSLINIHRQQHFVIANVQKQSESGSHWIWIGRSNDTLEYCDPLGSRGNAENLQLVLDNKSILKDISDLVISQDQYQPLDSVDCGLFCVYVAYHRLYRLHQPFSHVLSRIFTSDPISNEARVGEFVRQLEQQQQQQQRQDDSTARP